MTLQRLGALDFSCRLLPFVNSFSFNFVPGSGPRIHDIDNKYEHILSSRYVPGTILSALQVCFI